MQEITLEDFVTVDILKGQEGFSKALRVRVPLNYVQFAETGELYVKFLPPPYNKDDVDLLRSFIQNKETVPPDSWPMFQCAFVAVSGEYSIL